MSAHAKLSPSGAHRWLHCAASVPLESTCPDQSSDFADEGTAAHELGSMALTAGNDASAYLGRVIVVNGKNFTVDADMAGYVQVYIDYVRRIPGELLVEQRLGIDHITGEEGAGGTSDAVTLGETLLTITDLKYGMGVRVEATGNPQLMIYALGALREYEFIAEFKRVRMVIVQPRLDHISEWECSTEDLLAFGEKAKAGAERANHAQEYFDKYTEVHEKYFAPGESPCRFCKAKAICPVLAKQVLTTVADDFVDVSQPITPQLEGAAERAVDNATLGNLLGAAGLIEMWCKAIRGRAESELLAGHDVPGFKLVQGRKGARAWTDATEAETALKAMRLKTEQMYDLSLISPTTAEKLHKAKDIGPRQWPKLQELITQSEGRPSVAPEDDKRPALVIQATADEFEDVTDTVEDLI